MKKIYIFLFIILGIITIGVVSAGSYFSFYLPDVEKAPELKVEVTDERIERGKYLANHVTVCMDCHSTRDWTKFAGPMKGNPGGGGELFNEEMGFPGNIFAANITPYSLGEWTDGEVFRAITTGVDKDGKALFPVMPYKNYGHMDQEDLYSIIAYIRSLQPIENVVPERKLSFPVNFLVNSMPQEPNLVTKPDESNTLAYGGYLVNAASCVDCHSQTNKGAVIKGTEFGGGMAFHQMAGILRSPNITFDKQTGIGNWSKDFFIKRFKQYADSSYNANSTAPTDYNSPMPWHMYAGMKESDLAAIYDYLKSLPPINHAVPRFEPKE